MYLHLGESTIVRKKDIVGIFDLDTTTVMKSSRNYINKAEKEKRAVTVSYELPKSFVVTVEYGMTKVYESTYMSSTLEKRFK